MEPGEVRAQLADDGELLHAFDEGVHVPVLFEVADRLLEALLGQDVQGEVRSELGDVNRLALGGSALDYGQEIADPVFYVLLEIGQISSGVLQACQSSDSGHGRITYSAHQLSPEVLVPLFIAFG